MSQFNARLSFHFKEPKDLRQHNLLSEACEMNTVVGLLQTKLQSSGTELNFPKVQLWPLVCQLDFPAELLCLTPHSKECLHQGRETLLPGKVPEIHWF